MDLIPLSPSAPPVESTEEHASWLLLQGEVSLLRGDFTRASDLFCQVTELCPQSARFLYRQGISLFDFGSQEALKLACRRFKAAVVLEPLLIEGWHAWGNALFQLALKSGNTPYLLTALEKLEKAVELSTNYDSLGQLYWDLGALFNELARASGEAFDLYRANDAFLKALATREEFPADFWLGFAHASFELGSKVNDLRHTVKAINCIKHALSLNPSLFEAWEAFSKATARLYYLSHDEAHFNQTNDCFKAAHDLRPQNVPHLTNWGRFLMDAARLSRDAKKARAAIEKFHHAHMMKSDDPDILAAWGEAMALMGDLTERLELIIEGMNRARRAEESTDSPSLELIFSYGSVLLAMGRYFSDYDYAYQSVEKFQEGLSIDRTCDRLWHGIAVAYATVGELEDDIPAYERSLRFFEKALDLNPTIDRFVDYAITLYKLGELSHSQPRIEVSVQIFERVLTAMANAIYLHPDWLFHYACALHRLGDFVDEEHIFLRSIEILSHVAMLDPEFPQIHHRLALVFHDLGELSGEVDTFFRSLHHYRLAARGVEENDQLLLDWSIALINTAQRMNDPEEAELCFHDAEQKLIQAARLGNGGALYQIGCLYSIRGDFDRAMRYLEKASSFNALPPLAEILEDDWLDGLRMTSDFQTFISKLGGAR